MEHHLQLPAHLKQFVGSQRGKVRSLIEHLSAGWIQQIQHHIGHGGFARPGLPHQRQGAAFAEAKGHIIHRQQFLLRAFFAANIKLLGQVFHPNDFLIRGLCLPSQQLRGFDAVFLRRLDTRGRQRGSCLD